MKREIILAAAILFSGARFPAVASQDDWSCTRPSSIRALIDAFGVNIHMQQGWQYADAPKTIATLKSLGVSQVREAFTGLGHPGIELAARSGIRFDFVIDRGWGP